MGCRVAHIDRIVADRAKMMLEDARINIALNPELLSHVPSTSPSRLHEKFDRVSHDGDVIMIDNDNLEDEVEKAGRLAMEQLEQERDINLGKHLL